jgi:hypothetical protein
MVKEQWQSKKELISVQSILCVIRCKDIHSGMTVLSGPKQKGKVNPVTFSDTGQLSLILEEWP